MAAAPPVSLAAQPDPQPQSQPVSQALPLIAPITGIGPETWETPGVAEAAALSVRTGERGPVLVFLGLALFAFVICHPGPFSRRRRG
ncbi:MAG: hypothetical protein AAFQ88_07380 [Pseudomonadota bacterium]